MEAKISVGEQIPSFELEASDGSRVAVPTGAPLILIFFRGQWCPYCRWELTGLQTINRAVTEAGGAIVAVSPDTPEESAALRQNLSLAFPVLADRDLAVTDAFGLRHVGARAATGEDKPYPTTFIVDGSGTVRDIITNQTYRDRPSPKDVLAALTASVSG